MRIVAPRSTNLAFRLAQFILKLAVRAFLALCGNVAKARAKLPWLTLEAFGHVRVKLLKLPSWACEAVVP